VLEAAASGVWRHGCCWCVGRRRMVRTKLRGGGFRVGGLLLCSVLGVERRRVGGVEGCRHKKKLLIVLSTKKLIKTNKKGFILL
jgi:hypothetical protein